MLSDKCLRASDYVSLAQLVLGAVIMLLLCPGASALNPSLEVNQFLHKAWIHGEGLTGDTRSIVQTADGYLWLGTEFGLVRFDGVRFNSWAPPAGQRLPSNDIMALLATRDGTLWIGTTEGLASFRDGRLTAYAAIDREPVFALLEDHEGVVWAGLHARLCSVRSGKAECSEPSPFLRGVAMLSLFEDDEGRLWAAGPGSGLWQWKPGPPRKILSGSLIWPHALAPGDHATGLIAASDGLLRQVVGENSKEYRLRGERQPFARLLLRDHDDALWIGTAQGLLRVYQGKTTRFAHADGLSSDSVSTIFEDREGSIWVGTTNGIDRFREPAVFTISADQGLSGQAWSVLAARDGTVWIGTDDGLNRWHQGQMTIYRSATESRTQHGGGGAPHEITDAALPSNKIGALFEDQQDRLWVTTDKGVAWFENGRFTRVRGNHPVGPVNAVLPDRHQGIWISYPFYGLSHVVEGRVVESAPWPWSDETEPRLSAMVSDPVNDGFWIGFKQKGIAHLVGHQVGTTFGAKYGLSGRRVWHLHIDRESTLWAATEGGLSRIRDGRVATLTDKSGLPCDAVYWAIEDDASSLWLYTACGLVRITRPELDAWASNPKRVIHTTLFGEADGIRMHALLRPFTPVVTKSPDGKLWFAHLDGVSAIDPQHLPFNPLPPPVHIEQVTANGKRYDPASGLRLPPQIRDLVIDYTALSLAAPESVHFRFKLEGQDEGWREVVNQRQMEYSNLPPRKYVFRVKASNNSGVWNENGDSLEFSIAPAYYQTTWFRAASVVVFFISLWALYRYRLHQLAREFNARLDERVGERTRIARNLHDTLLQSFQGALIEFQAARNLFSKGRQEAIQALDTAMRSAQDAIVVGRDAIHDLRDIVAPQAHLEQLLETAGEELASSNVSAGTRPAFQVTVEGPAQALSPILQDEVYQIGREVLRNAFRHASASRIEAEIRYSEHVLRLRIRDDGKGIDQNVLENGMLPGHWGLPGIRERAKRIGARVVFWSEAGAGTEVELAVPSGIAYAKSTARRRFGPFRRKSDVA